PRPLPGRAAPAAPAPGRPRPQGLVDPHPPRGARAAHHQAGAPAARPGKGVMTRRGALRVGLLALAAGMAGMPGASPSRGAAAEGRQVPVALAWGAGDRLMVACRDSRRILTVVPDGWRVADAWPLAFRPAWLAPVDDRSAFLVGGVDGEL